MAALKVKLKLNMMKLSCQQCQYHQSVRCCHLAMTCSAEHDGCVLHPSAGFSPLSHARQLTLPWTLQLVHSINTPILNCCVSTLCYWGCLIHVVKQTRESSSLTISTPQIGSTLCAYIQSDFPSFLYQKLIQYRKYSCTHIETYFHTCITYFA